MIHVFAYTCSFTLFHVHDDCTQHTVRGRIASDGADVVIAEEVAEIASDIQLRKASDQSAVFHQVRHLYRSSKMTAGRDIAA